MGKYTSPRSIKSVEKVCIERKKKQQQQQPGSMYRF